MSVVRVKAIVEGYTEERFIKGILAPYLGARGVYLSPIRVMTSRSLNKRGGLNDFLKPKQHIETTLKNDREAYCTTLFDYYALPHEFPGMDDLERIHGAQARVVHLEAALSAVIGDGRFFSYLALHEFEAMLFSDLDQLEQGCATLARTGSRKKLEAVLHACGEPEAIDDGPHTAPSKRLADLFPGFEKPVHGIAVADRIGVDGIRAACPHFDAWVRKLESLA